MRRNLARTSRPSTRCVLCGQTAEEMPVEQCTQRQATVIACLRKLIYSVFEEGYITKKLMSVSVQIATRCAWQAVRLVCWS